MFCFFVFVVSTRPTPVRHRTPGVQARTRRGWTPALLDPGGVCRQSTWTRAGFLAKRCPADRGPRAKRWCGAFLLFGASSHAYAPCCAPSRSPLTGKPVDPKTVEMMRKFSEQCAKR